LLSGTVHDQIRNKLSMSFHSLGEMSFRISRKPVRTFSITDAEGSGPLPSRQPAVAAKGNAKWLRQEWPGRGGRYGAQRAHECSVLRFSVAPSCCMQPCAQFRLAERLSRLLMQQTAQPSHWHTFLAVCAIRSPEPHTASAHSCRNHFALPFSRHRRLPRRSGPLPFRSV